MNSEKSARVVRSWLALVLGIDRTRSKTKVAESIIQAVAIDMVYVLFRPLAIRVKPCQSMREITFPINANDAVSMSYLAGNATRRMTAMPSDADCPSEQSGLAVIGEKLSKALGCRFVHTAF
jgi:hypothetical protein